MKDLFWIALGAAAGANLRFAVSKFSARYISASLPYGTFIINVTGSLLLGFFLIWTTERVLADPRAAAGRRWLLRCVHYLFQLQLRNFRAVRARALRSGGRQLSREQCVRVASGSGGRYACPGGVRMAQPAVKVSIYINEADEWHHRPLHLEVLRMLHEEGCAGGTVLRAVAGFTGRAGVQTTSLVDAGGKLPLVIQFIDHPEHVERVMPKLKEMAGRRLIVTESVQIA